jgi:hypothetical protein
MYSYSYAQSSAGSEDSDGSDYSADTSYLESVFGSFLAGFVPVLASEIHFCHQFLFPTSGRGAEGAREEESGGGRGAEGVGGRGAEGEEAAEALLVGIDQDFIRLVGNRGAVIGHLVQYIPVEGL